MTESDLVSSAMEKSKKIIDNSASSMMKAILKQQVNPQTTPVALGDQLKRGIQTPPQSTKRSS